MGSGGDASAASATRHASVRIVLVDDHGIIRQGLRAILEREPDLTVVGEASCHAEALEVVAVTRPSMALVDLKLSRGDGADGLVLCRDLARTHPTVSVLVLTTYLDADLLSESQRWGARGYLVKDADSSELVAAIRRVARGRTAFDPRAVRMARNAPGRTRGANRLTAREAEVLASLARGNATRAVARELFISEATVAFHVRNTLRKLGVSTRAEAVYLAVRMALI